MTGTPSILVLGVGNTLMQDDGIGVWAVRGLRQEYALPSGVRLIEAGIAGLKLLSELDGAGHLLIIDAVIGGGRPGEVYRLTPGDLPRGRGPLMSAHEVGIVELLQAAELLGKRPDTRILGVQPLEVRSVGLELTPPLKEALPRIIEAAAQELRNLGASVEKKGNPIHA